jgi:hypothetical protein
MDDVARVCEIPVEFKARGDVSLIQLVRESGFEAKHVNLTVAALCEYLRDKPALIDAWFGYSEDKRASSGWYIRQRPNGQFEVAFFPKGESLITADRALACAEFVLREILAIAGEQADEATDPAAGTLV